MRAPATKLVKKKERKKGKKEMERENAWIIRVGMSFSNGEKGEKEEKKRGFCFRRNFLLQESHTRTL